MKTLFKIIIITFSMVLLTACSGNDENDGDGIIDIDPTNYMLAGKILNNHLTIITFSTNNNAYIRSIDENVSANYTVHGDTIKIENYGFIIIQNNQIVSQSIEDLDMSQAQLLQNASENQFKNKEFGGLIPVTQGFEVEHYIRFSSTGVLYGYGAEFEDANPTKEFEIIGNIAGIHHENGHADIFYIQNNKLVCEIKTEQLGAPIYFSSEGLSQVEF